VSWIDIPVVEMPEHPPKKVSGSTDNPAARNREDPIVANWIRVNEVCDFAEQVVIRQDVIFSFNKLIDDTLFLFSLILKLIFIE
jgi:hypothetical protein